MEDRQSWFDNRRLSQYLDNVRTHYLDKPEIAIEDWKVIRMALIRLAMSKLDPLEKQITRCLLRCKICWITSQRSTVIPMMPIITP